MIRYGLWLGLLGFAVWAGTQSASAMQPTPQAPVYRPSVTSAMPQNRDAIRQMPLLERPNRPGHFYGNTVRWLHGRTNHGG